MTSVIGFYHWGGTYSTGLAAGVADVVALNARIVRVAVSPRMDRDYQRGTACREHFSLAGALADADLQAVLTDPRLDTALLTAYDGVSYGDCNTASYLSRSFYTPENVARMTAEYSDFVYQLASLLNSHQKRIILSHWEGDNALYCGSAYGYLSGPDFQIACDAAYAEIYGGNEGPQDSVWAMVQWLKIRHQGVQEGKARARAAGVAPVEIEVAPEISAVRMLREKGYPSVLYDVVPQVPFDYVSYSSYESLNREDPAAALREDLDTIQRVSGSGRIIVGEVGYGRRATGERLVATTRAVVDAAVSWGAAFVIQWNLYDQSAEYDFGMYDEKGAITELGEYYRWLLRQPAGVR